MLRDASVIEVCTVPVSRSAGAAGGGGTDCPVCTAAHEGTTAAAMFAAAFAWLREPTDPPFPFPLPPSPAISRMDTLSRFH